MPLLRYVDEEAVSEVDPLAIELHYGLTTPPPYPAESSTPPRKPRAGSGSDSPNKRDRLKT